MILVSACFANIKCRYDGSEKTINWINDLVTSGHAVPVCPEVLGGLPIPRPACEIVTNPVDGTRIVMDTTGVDRTVAFILGAERTLAIAKACGITMAILKANSPSCGKGHIYDGTFSGEKVVGNGFSAQILIDHGFKIFNEDDELTFEKVIEMEAIMSKEQNEIDSYISTFPENVQLKLNEIRDLIKLLVPEATEKISYQMPTFYLDGNLVHFAGYKNHIGFYPTPSGITAFEDELKPYKYAKGSARFPVNEPLPIELIKKIVLYRLEETEAKKKKTI